MSTKAAKQKSSIQFGPNGGPILTPELLDDFLAYMRRKGRAGETVFAYRSYLTRIYAYLPQDKEIVQGTLDGFWEQMAADGFSTNSINVAISAANSLFEYCGRRDLQLPKHARQTPAQPELTRAEYQRLLQAAKRLGKEQTYLLVKMFACTGVGLSELKDITIEAVRIGRIFLGGEKGEKTEVVLPDFLREELENYAERQDIAFGPIFINRSGNPLSRSTVAQLIGDLAAEADVAREKCNPRCLQKLCYETKRLVERNLYTQMQKMYEGILAEEQRDVGWV